MSDPLVVELETITARVLDAVARDERCSPHGARLLLRQYLDTGREDLQDGLGRALEQALASAALDSSITGRAAWLTLFVEAAAVADDDRIVAAVTGLADGLRREWPMAARVREGAASVDACLHASAVVNPDEIVPPAIDELERIIGGSYEPGDGVRGDYADQIAAAAALLTGFEITGRLPYSMLAEELMQAARRLPARDDDVAVQCEAAVIWCRLAALHRDADYCGAAVVAGGADYFGDAARVLAAQSSRALAAPAVDAASYALALRELISLR